MKFFFDNNLPPKFTIFMKYLEQDVMHLRDRFNRSARDVVWLPYVGKNNIILVTCDKRIRHNPSERELLIKYKVGAFFLDEGNLKKFAIARQIITNWEKMIEYAEKEPKPFAFRIPPKGQNLTRLSL